MGAGKLCASGVLLAFALLCQCASRASYLKNPWASLDARYVSWEPTTDAVPAVDDRKLASEYLATSLRLWKEADYPSYIYARARQVRGRELELTTFQVIAGKVAQRTLVRLNPEQLASSMRNNRVQRTSVWHESGRSLGTHEGGFPVATIDELYERCRRDVLATHPELRARMHFDRRGFLQACGFATGDCDDCPAVSVQVVAKYDLPAAWDLRRNLCVDYDGLATARGDRPDWTGGCQRCFCNPGSEPPSGKPRPSPRRDLAAPEDLCSIDPAAPGCPNPLPAEDTAGLEDICETNPTAYGCGGPPPPLDGAWGNWGGWACMTLLDEDCRGSPIPPDVRAPICVGKATPTESWKVALDRCERMNHAARSAKP